MDFSKMNKLYLFFINIFLIYSTIKVGNSTTPTRIETTYYAAHFARMSQLQAQRREKAQGMSQLQAQINFQTTEQDDQRRQVLQAMSAQSFDDGYSAHVHQGPSVPPIDSSPHSLARFVAPTSNLSIEKNCWMFASSDHFGGDLRAERLEHIKNMRPREFESFSRSLSFSLLSFAIEQRDYELFKAILNKPISFLNTIDIQTPLGYHRTILHLLCKQNFESDPEMLSLVDHVLAKHKKLVNYHCFFSKTTCFNLILENRSLSDEQVCMILQKFVSSGFDFVRYCRLNMRYIFFRGPIVIDYLNRLYNKNYIAIVDNGRPLDTMMNLSLINNPLFEAHFFDGDQKNVELRKVFLENLAVERLDEPAWADGSSLGHLFLHRNEPDNFRLWLSRGALCTAITDNKGKRVEYNNETILSVLCIKGLDNYPDLVNLICIVLDRNPSLLDISKEYSFDYIKPVHLVLRNRYLGDEETLRILRKMQEKGFDFTSDASICSFIRSNGREDFQGIRFSLETKPRCYQFLKDLVQTNS
jgi:hypothetical protein